MKVRPIAIIGNGPSISGFDWNRLDGVDTMAMNAFNKVCASSGWFPTYYCLFRRLDGIWGDEQVSFMRRCGPEFLRMFYIDTMDGGPRVFGDSLDSVPNAVPVSKIELPEPPSPRYGGVRWRAGYAGRVAKAMSALASEVGEVEAVRLAEEAGPPPDDLLPRGMVKWYRAGGGGEYGGKDVSEAMGWSPSFMRPKSFSEFYDGPGDSSTDCARVASLLGYNLILLVGFDGRVAVSESGVVDPASWGIPGVFNGKDLNLADVVSCPVCRTTEALDEKREELWQCFVFSESLAGNPMTVWNCTEGSAIRSFDRVPIDDAMAMIRGWS